MALQRQVKRLRTHNLLIDNQEIPQPRPFAETRLGKLPAELRIQIYHELVATPPPHAGRELTTQGICAENPTQHRPATPRTVFVHLKASTLKVLGTCRQIYQEAQPVFYARTSYYAANEKEFEQLVSLNSSYSPHTRLRTNTITSLCVKDVLSSTYADRFLPCHTSVLERRLEKWESLRKIYLCIRVGEEIGYIGFLFSLPHMSFGVIEFLDDYHWLLRLQRPEEEWKSQYACVFTEAYRRGKGGVKLSWADIVTQERPLRRDSGASGLEQGQERLVEVSIDGLHEKPMPWEMGAMMDKFRYLSLESR